MSERRSSFARRLALACAIPAALAALILPALLYVRDLGSGRTDAATWALLAFLALAVVSLASAVAAARIAQRTTSAARGLALAANALARGETVRIAHVAGDDEFADLGRAFEDMAARFHGSIDAIAADRARLSAILATMDDGVILLNGDQRVLLANRAATELIGLPDDAAASGRPLVQLVSRHELYELARNALDSNASRPRSVEMHLDARDVLVIATPMTSGGAALLLIQDVSAVRRAETVRRDFVANVSHELKTPIASLKALVETLESGALDDPPAARDFLGRMHVEVDGLAQLVQELLDLARIESGRARFMFALHEAAELAASALERLRPQATRAGLRASLENDPSLPVVFADGGRVEGALMNLIHNAIKFTPEGGYIRVRVVPTTLRGGSGVRFLVEDTGVGIAPEGVSRVWERFYKTDRSRATTGTGLGLAIVKHVVDAHGGVVGVSSVQDEGSSFWFDLPAAADDGHGQSTMAR